MVHVEAIKHRGEQDHDQGECKKEDGRQHAAVLPPWPGAGCKGRKIGRQRWGEGGRQGGHMHVDLRYSYPGNKSLQTLAKPTCGEYSLGLARPRFAQSL